MRLLALIAFFMVVLSAQLCFAQGEEAGGSAGGGEMMEAREGDVGFFEIPSLSIAESEAFYGSLFGWEFMPMDDTFSMFSGPNNTMGGFSTMGTVAAGGVIPYITVDDIDAKLAEISAAGGATVVEKMAVPEDMGSIAMFSDPHGNTIGLWSAE